MKARDAYFTVQGTMHMYYFVVVIFLLQNRGSLAPDVPNEKKKVCNWI